MSKKNKKHKGGEATRTYREVAAVGGQNSDWQLSLITEDSDVWQNAWALTSRVRDLFKCNPLYIAYRENLWANVFGANGIMLRMRVKETEDRVIHTADEEKCIRAYEARRNRVMEWVASREGREFTTRAFLHVTGNNGTRKASVKVGDPDVFANTIIEKRWLEWQRAEFCDTRGTRNYKTIRQLRLISAVRDGDFFIRMIRAPSVNKFGFALQLINAEWCDRFFNGKLPNGNEVRMGIEHQWSSWGIGKPVAYYFIKRQQQDWQFSIPGAFNFTGNGDLHERVPAAEILHYARAVDADGTRPAPWVASTIPSSRQRDQAMLAEVVAWREAACKTGFYESTVIPEGGTNVELPNPQGFRAEHLGPGETRGLPWGVTFRDRNPLHPNANVKEFRMASIQDGCAGMPGANYSTMASDYAAINFSAGRLQRLDSNEAYMLLQTFDIDYAETKIFEEWLYMSLLTGAVPLPVAKLEKFNSKAFQGRRWRGVDELKEVNAAALRVANHFSSDYKECSEIGVDFEETLFEQAEANMLKEQLGITTAKTVETPPQAADAPDVEGGEEPTATPAPKKSGKKTKLANGQRFAIAD